MKMNPLKRRNGALFFTLFALCSYGSSSRADKVDIFIGGYSLSAKTAQSSGSLSGLGAYAVDYRHALTSHIEFDAGYSLMFAQVVTGDMGYGPNVGLDFFPITNVGSQTTNLDGTSVTTSEKYRPYIGAAFHQREFQSVSSSYAGFGVSAGSEMDFRHDFGLKGEARYIQLQGPSSGKATELDILLGATFHF